DGDEVVRNPADDALVGQRARTEPSGVASAALQRVVTGHPQEDGSPFRPGAFLALGEVKKPGDLPPAEFGGGRLDEGSPLRLGLGRRPVVRPGPQEGAQRQKRAGETDSLSHGKDPPGGSWAAGRPLTDHVSPLCRNVSWTWRMTGLSGVFVPW